MKKTNAAIPLTNKELIELAVAKKKVRIIVIRPTDGCTAFDENMLVNITLTEQKNYLIKIPMSGVKMWVIRNDDNRFQEKDRGYIFQAFSL